MTETTEAPEETKEPEQPKVDEVLQALLGKMTDIDDTKPALKIMVWGDPDAGKTTFAGTVPNALIVDAEDGMTSLKNHPDLIAGGSKRYPYNTFAGFEVLLQYLKEGNPAFDWVETLIVDTFSTLHKKGLAETREREFRKAPSLVNRYKAETEHHTENNEHIRLLLDTMASTRRNLVVLAHSRLVEPKNMPAKTFPDFSEKLSSALVSMVDICAYIEKREVDGEIKRVWRFRTDSNTMTKCRVGGLPDEAVDVTWPQLWTKWEEHLASGKE